MSDELNGTMMQHFHWYSPDDGTFWDEAGRQAAALAQAGFTAVWLPPAYKGIGGASDVGYGVYDLYDLGEFEQKGSVRTKYGTRQQYLQAIAALRAAGLQVYADTVLNHRIGGDATETARATPFLQDDRVHPRGELREIEAYTRFSFSRTQGPALALRVALVAFRRRRLRRQGQGIGHGLPVRGQAVRRSGFPGEGQFRLPDGLRSRFPERGSARRADLGGGGGIWTPPASMASGSTRSSTSRPGFSRTGWTRWRSTRAGTCSPWASTGRPMSTPCICT
jgi:hypothetical protein